MIVHLREFLGIVAVITVVPGPDTALVIRNAVRHGRASGLLTAVGCTLGLTVWALAASVGLATLLGMSASLFGAVRLAGAVYLLFLGSRLLRSGWRTARSPLVPDIDVEPHAADSGGGAQPKRGEAPRRSPPSVRGPLLEGLLADLLNPKAAVFFTALLPQFVSAGDAITSVIVLGLVAAAAALLGLAAYALLAARVGAVLRRRWPAAILDAITGLVLLVFGAVLVRRAPGLSGASGSVGR
ncbi:MAG TPA: LysE family translocator [Gemmatimonadaceae bacterium]